mgnify:CR=1 FL=1
MEGPFPEGKAVSPGGDLPSREEFLRLGRQYNVLPVCRPFLGDALTPVSLLKLVATGDHFLLESVAGGERVARYSFVGLGFSRFFSSRGRQCRWQVSPREPVVSREGDAVLLLQAFLGSFRTPSLPGYPFLMAQAAGWFSGGHAQGGEAQDHGDPGEEEGEPEGERAARHDGRRPGRGGRREGGL